MNPQPAHYTSCDSRGRTGPLRRKADGVAERHSPSVVRARSEFPCTSFLSVQDLFRWILRLPSPSPPLTEVLPLPRFPPRCFISLAYTSALLLHAVGTTRDRCLSMHSFAPKCWKYEVFVWLSIPESGKQGLVSGESPGTQQASLFVNIIRLFHIFHTPSVLAEVIMGEES